MTRFILSLAFVTTSFFTSAQHLTFDNSIERENGVRLELSGLEEGELIKYTQLDLEGNVIQYGQYLDGKPHGTWTMYLKDGTTSTMEFDRGQRIALITKMNDRTIKVIYRENKPFKSIAYFK